MDTPYQEYRLPDGEIIGGTCPLEIVESMAQRKFVTPRSRQSYRRATARRVKSIHDDVNIDPATDETFVADMLAHGLLVQL